MGFAKSTCVLFLSVSISLVVADFSASYSYIKPEIDKGTTTAPVGSPTTLQWANATTTLGSDCYQKWADHGVRGTPDEIVNMYSIDKTHLDAVLCVGQPEPVVKEMDGDSGGPVLVKKKDEVGYTQIGVNGGMWAADELWSNAGSAGTGYSMGTTHMGFYVNLQWRTIAPWLAKILSGDLVGAKAMTCAELGGPTLSNNSGKKRNRKLLYTPAGAKINDRTSRKLLVAGGSTAVAAELPFMVSEGQIYGGGWNENVLTGGDLDSNPTDEMFLSNGCTGTLIANNVVLHAAHCSAAPNTLQKHYLIGAFNISEIFDNYRNVDTYQEKITHPCYNFNTGPVEDVEVVILKKKWNNIKPVQVVQRSDSIPYPADSVFAGWGYYCNTYMTPADQAMKCTGDSVATLSDSGSSSNPDSNNCPTTYSAFTTSCTKTVEIVDCGIFFTAYDNACTYSDIHYCCESNGDDCCKIDVEKVAGLAAGLLLGMILIVVSICWCCKCCCFDKRK
jgi:hypothetical protein